MTPSDADRALAREYSLWMKSRVTGHKMLFTDERLKLYELFAQARVEGRQAALESVAKLCDELSGAGRAIAKIIRALPTGEGS